MAPTPEQLAREQIDDLLTASGWVIQNYKELNLGAGRDIAIREVPLKTGPCDYLLLVDRKPVGVIEAKKVGTTLSGATNCWNSAMAWRPRLARSTRNRTRFAPACWISR